MGIDKQYYADAALEVSNGYVDSALYVKALAIAGGEDKKAKAIYIGLRAEEFQSGARKRTIAKVVDDATGLSVGTARAALLITQDLTSRKVFSVVVAIGVGCLTFFTSIELIEGVIKIMEEMDYIQDYPSNILLYALLGSGFVALIVSWIVGRHIWPKKDPSVD